MIVSAESQKAIDVYLATLRKELRPLRPEDANDIVEEIHAHILDKTAGVTAEDVVASTIVALGTPEELAGRYRTDELLKRAQVTRSPLVSIGGRKLVFDFTKACPSIDKANETPTPLHTLQLPPHP